MNNQDFSEYDNHPAQQDADAWKNKANTLSQRGKSKEAVAAYYTFIKLTPAYM